MNQKISIIYFSPTGNTRKTLQVMGESISDMIETIDSTCSDYETRNFTETDFVIFGSPVYGGRIPLVARERFFNMKGKDTPCFVVVSYGNRDYDDALLELSDMVKSLGFVVKGAAAVVGRHTYGDIQITRPDENDFMQDKAFAVKAFQKANDRSDFQIPGNIPYKDGGAGGKFRPLTSSVCVKCGLCVRECPVHAIKEDCMTITETCISCFRCIRNCPVHAKNMDTEEYESFAKMFTQKLKDRKENQYFM